MDSFFDSFKMFQFGFIGIAALSSIIFIAMFFLFISIIRKNIKTEKRNDNSPVLKVSATVVTKRTSVYGHDSVHQSYYATFQVESGDRMELLVSGYDFGRLAEGDTGMLTFQGTRFLSFDRRY